MLLSFKAVGFDPPSGLECRVGGILSLAVAAEY